MFRAKTAEEIYNSIKEEEADSSDLPSCCHRTKYYYGKKEVTSTVTHDKHMAGEEYHCDDTHGESGTIWVEPWDTIEIEVETVLWPWAEQEAVRQAEIERRRARNILGVFEVEAPWQVSYNQENHRFEITNGVVSYYSYTEEDLEEWIKEMITVSFIEESFIQAVADGDSLAKVAYTDWIKEQGREEELAIS